MLLMDVTESNATNIACIDAWFKERQGAKITLAVEDGIVYGFIVYDKTRIYYVYTSSEGRRTGIATYLIKSVINILLNSTSLYLRAAFNPEDVGLVMLFSKCSFRNVGRAGNSAIYEYTSPTISRKQIPTSGHEIFQHYGEQIIDKFSDCI